jgi:iron complex transport system ATP-binding protein
MERIIEIRNATVYRGETRVFNGLSLEIPLGCHTAILGPNGSGKSTLLKLVSREIYPVRRDGSYVRVFGQERWNVWNLRTRLGIVSHDLHEQYHGNVRGIDVILSGFYSSIGIWPHQQFRPEQVERAKRLMDLLEIAAMGNTPYAEMSAGEQRRFLLARALVHDPDALILDEPTAGLDLKACFQYLDLIRRLMWEGRTVILVTHRIHEIPPEVSRVVLLRNGEVVADGEKPKILTGENLSRLYGTPVELVHVNGFYQVMPGGQYPAGDLGAGAGATR